MNLKPGPSGCVLDESIDTFLSVVYLRGVFKVTAIVSQDLNQKVIDLVLVSDNLVVLLTYLSIHREFYTFSFRFDVH